MPRCGGCGGSSGGGGGGGGGGGFLPGMMMAYAPGTVPAGWLACEGQAVSRATYAPLFAAISTTYGAGDGVSTFNLPDARNRTLIGIGGSYTLGQQVGAATHTLTIGQMPAHVHPPEAPGGFVANDSISGLSAEIQAPGFNGYEVAANTGYAGGNEPHNNMQPSLAVGVIIKT